MTKVCRPVSRRLSVIEQGDLLWESLIHKSQTSEKIRTTKRADSRWLSSRDSKNTNSRPIMTEEISKNWKELSSLNEVRLTVLWQWYEQLRRDQLLFHEQLSEQNRELREAIEKSLNEMEELKRFQGTTFDTIARRKLVCVEKNLSVDPIPLTRVHRGFTT